jgi:CheY-like chemotaxis protein
VGVEPPEVTIHVRDDGAGIDPELLPRVFELFVQASRTLDRAHGGLGIGLTLVERLVKLHGGRVEAHSEGLGKGAEFIVSLPVSRKKPPGGVQPPIVTDEISRRILIVDDNTDSARSLSLIQNRRGHKTRVAFTGPDAVSVAAEFLPEVILLDIGLPGMDGFEVARKIREIPGLENCFLVAMTGYGSGADRDQARLSGFDEYLIKPADLKTLRGWLRELGQKS